MVSALEATGERVVETTSEKNRDGDRGQVVVEERKASASSPSHILPDGV